MDNDILVLINRIERLEEQVAELSSRTMGQMMIGPGLLKPEMPDISRLGMWPPKPPLDHKHLEGCTCLLCR